MVWERIKRLETKELSVSIALATTEPEIAACYPVMLELRPHVTSAEVFVAQVLRMQQERGYHLAYAADDAGPAAVAGFHFGESFSWGRYLYVDDLVTLERARSKGFGAALLRWLEDYACDHGCRELHLDSGFHRERAHAFYAREGMERRSYHFKKVLGQQ